MSQTHNDPKQVASARRIFLLTSTAIYVDMALDAPVIRARLAAGRDSAGEKGPQ